MKDSLVSGVGRVDDSADFGVGFGHMTHWSNTVAVDAWFHAEAKRLFGSLTAEAGSSWTANAYEFTVAA